MNQKKYKGWLSIGTACNYRLKEAPFNNFFNNENIKLLENLENNEFEINNDSYLKDLKYFKYNDLYTNSIINKPSYNLCSIVSYKYIIRAITFYNSLEKWSKDSFHLWICTIDEKSYNILKSLKLHNVTIIKSSKVTVGLLKDIRVGRNDKEYCWTLKAIFIDYILNNYSIDSILYSDTDMFFFAHIKHVFNEWGKNSFFVCSKRGNEKLEYNCGHYQAGLIGFRNDYYGKKILTWYKEKCINWCYDTNDYEQERWGDQKYLDSIPLFFDSIKISNHFGINAAPWNLILNNKCYSVNINNLELYINSSRLCAYHFGSINIYDMENFDLWDRSPVNINETIIKNIYRPYILSLNNTIRSLVALGIDVTELYDDGNVMYAKNHYKLHISSI